MPASTNRLRFLLEKFHAGTITREETGELKNALDDPSMEQDLRSEIESIPPTAHFFDEEKSEQMLAKILAQPQDEKFPARHNRRWMALAATLIIGFTGFWFYNNSKQPVIKDNPGTSAVATTVISPGAEKAILVLEDGSRIDLDKAGNGQLAIQGETAVTKDAGQLTYTGDKSATAQTFNTLITPRGGQYQLTLADGTKVWMNAGSSLRYPTAFTTANRIVELMGEAYFEVAKNPSRPFLVKVHDMEVKVLGTHFNVMAYSNEKNIRTTLLEGSVDVSKAGTATRLKPGQQAQMAAGKGVQVVNNVDLDEVVAWKNGYFQFNRAGLDVIMRQVERWYDVDITYEGRVPQREFGGKIARTSQIDDMLKILEASNVKFRIEGRKIIVKNIP
ncbi:MAG: FecR family protein [Chitinophagaceae bacterium]|nr:MAG: FecR family protein [Chitinophagaceae bacterium]